MIMIKPYANKMFNLEEEKEFCFWQGNEAENFVFLLFLTSGFAAFICVWLLVMPNSNN